MEGFKNIAFGIAGIMLALLIGLVILSNARVSWGSPTVYAGQVPPVTSPATAPPAGGSTVSEAPSQGGARRSGCPTHIRIDGLEQGPQGQALAARIHQRLCAEGGELTGVEEGYRWHADWDPPSR